MRAGSLPHASRNALRQASMAESAVEYCEGFFSCGSQLLTASLMVAQKEFRLERWALKDIEHVCPGARRWQVPHLRVRPCGLPIRKVHCHRLLNLRVIKGFLHLISKSMLFLKQEVLTQSLEQDLNGIRGWAIAPLQVTSTQVSGSAR